MLSEQEKIKIVKTAFDKFIKRIVELLDEQKILFERIMGEIETRKIKECKGKICEIYRKNNQ